MLPLLPAFCTLLPQVPTKDQVQSVTELLRERSQLPPHVMKVRQYRQYTGCMLACNARVHTTLPPCRAAVAVQC